MKFENKLQKLRKEKGLSQEELAEKLNVTRQSVSKWESGQSYPEMDKLLLLCKIFDCTLEELTNDSISADNIYAKEGLKKGAKHINNFLNDINRAIDKLKTMSNDEIKKCFIEILVLSIILSVIHVPLSEILHNGYFYGYNVISTLWNIIAAIIEFAYFVMSIALIFYMFKIRYLDVDSSKENKKHSDLKEEENIKAVDHNNTSNNPWKEVVVLFFKFILACIALPITISIFGLMIAFFILLFITIDGINLLGPLLILFSLIIAASALSKVLWGIVFSINRNYRKVLASFIIFSIIFSVGVCISSIEATKYSYSDTVPSDVKTSMMSKEVDFNSNYYLSDKIIYNDDVTYTVNNNIGSAMIITLTYYSDYTSPNIIIRGNEIDISHFNHDIKFNTYAYNQIKDYLKEHKIYNYANLYKVSINITANDQNISKLRYFPIAN